MQRCHPTSLGNPIVDKGLSCGHLISAMKFPMGSLYSMKSYIWYFNISNWRHKSLCQICTERFSIRLHVTCALMLSIACHWCQQQVLGELDLHEQCLFYMFLPLTHSGHRVLSCPAPSVHLSVHPSVRPALVTTLQPTIFHESSSYVAQSLTLVWTWTQLIMEFLCSFSRIQWHFEILWIHWLTCFLV